MCGITGIFNLNAEPVNPDLLAQMTRLLSHRGPDDEGICIWSNAGFGNRRLSIIDLSSRGHQPMSNENGTIWITYNGEIYNHRELRGDLEKAGHRYRSQTDTETIIHLYEEKGVDCLQYLDGEFAFSIWDSNKKNIFSARDRLGVKPFYYRICDKYFIFASEIKAILAHPDIRKRLDVQALSDYLSFSVSPAPRTLFKDIFKLEAGHYLLVNNNGGIIKKQYWDAVPAKKINCTQGQAIETLRFKLGESIRKRMMSDVPLGAFLSGGVDSSANVALMSRLVKEPIKTFNVAIEGVDAYDESYFAEMVSRKFNSDYRSVRIGFDGFRQLFGDLAYFTGEPLCDYACIPNFYLAKLAREKNVPVIQVGEGNDELFCGYRSYTAALNLIRFYSPLPSVIKTAAFNFLKFAQGENIHYALEQIAKGRDAFLGTSYLFTEKEKAGMFNQAANQAKIISSLDFVAKIYKDFLNKYPQASPLDKMAYLDLKVRLPELLLMRADKMTMANSVEARFPFLDYQFVEYALSLPDEFKYRRNETKYIYKKSLDGILPKEIIFQPKKGFAGNPVNIFNQEFQRYVLELYQDVEPLLAEWFNPGDIKNRLVFNPGRVSSREGMKIWSIFNLMLWLKKFFIDK